MKWWRRRREKQEDPGLLMPPEGVPLKLPIAGLGARLAAQIIDIALTSLAALAIIILMASLGYTRPQTLMAVGALLYFLIRIPYYALTELAWNGQTLGKRLMKIKVVSHDGGSLTTHSLVLRNLMKEAEIFLPGTLLVTLSETTPVSSLIALAWIVGVLSVPLFNPYRMRLGDLAAGTHVIALPVPFMLSDIAAAVPARKAGDGYTFLAHQLDHYGAVELQTLEGLLRALDSPVSAVARSNQMETVATIVEKIRAKIEYPNPVPQSDHARFLQDFYNAQREHLEQRQLFGERRVDKHHRSAEKQT